MASESERLDRLLHLVELLRTEGPLTAKELAEHLGVSPRTLNRDIRELKEQGIDLPSDAAGFYRLPSVAGGPCGLSEEETLALLLTAEIFGQRGIDVPELALLSQATRKLYEACSPSLRRRFDQHAGVLAVRRLEQAKPDRTAAFFEPLCEAAIARRRVRIRYHSLSESKFIDTDLAPYRLVHAKRTWYCIGQSSFHREVRTFNLARIGTLEELDKSFRMPKSFSLDDYFGNAWRMIREGGVHPVRLRFARSVAQNVAETVWHPTQRVRWQDDGSILVDFDVDGLREVSWWILGYGSQVEVLAPPMLRTIVQSHALAMLRLYGVGDDRAEPATKPRPPKAIDSDADAPDEPAADIAAYRPAD